MTEAMGPVPVRSLPLRRLLNQVRSVACSPHRSEERGPLMVSDGESGERRPIAGPAAASAHAAAERWTLRDARAAEAEAILALWRQACVASGPTDTAPDLRRLLAHPTATVVVAERDGALVGTVVAAFDGWRGSLYRLAVHPAHRRRGCARALVAAAERRLAGWGARRLPALVERDRPGATAFWAAAGYAPEPGLVRHVRAPSAGPPARAARR